MAKILICDDEAPIRALIHASLDTGRYEIAEATDGDQALDSSRDFEPDLIVLDMMMPGRNGLEVIRALRENPQFAATKIILVTASSKTTDRDAAAAAGADSFLAKPFSPHELASVVAALLGERA